jgi:nucleotide-binding universal stress UspA family protein
MIYALHRASGFLPWGAITGPRPDDASVAVYIDTCQYVRRQCPRFARRIDAVMQRPAIERYAAATPNTLRWTAATVCAPRRGSPERSVPMPDPTPTRRILVPLDESDRAMTALAWVHRLATGSSDVVLLNVVPLGHLVMAAPMLPVDYYTSTIRYQLDAAAGYLLAVAGEELGDVGASVSRVVREGIPAEEILDVARSERVDMILMTTQGRGATGRLVVGSVADEVARSATVPTMLIHAGHGEEHPPGSDTARVNRLAVLLDGSDRARAALPVAAALARQLGAPILLLRVVPTQEELFATRDGGTTGRLYQRVLRAMPVLPRAEGDDRYYQEYVDAIEAALASEASRLAASSGLEVTSRLVAGPVVPSITGALAPGDVIVMTSHGEGGIRRWMLGSVAEKLIHQAAAPVVLVPLPEREALLAPAERPDAGTAP